MAQMSLVPGCIHMGWPRGAFPSNIETALSRLLALDHFVDSFPGIVAQAEMKIRSPPWWEGGPHLAQDVWPGEPKARPPWGQRGVPIKKSGVTSVALCEREPVTVYARPEHDTVGDISRKVLAAGGSVSDRKQLGFAIAHQNQLDSQAR